MEMLAPMDRDAYSIAQLAAQRRRGACVYMYLCLCGISEDVGLRVPAEPCCESTLGRKE